VGGCPASAGTTRRSSRRAGGSPAVEGPRWPSP